MKSIFIISVFTVLALIACKHQEPEIQFRITRHAHLADLPSASGVCFAQDKIYIIGDDIRWLLTLNKNWQITDSLALSSVDTLVNNRTPGEVKADFESMTYFNYEKTSNLLVLSSGSKQITRDTAYLINTDENNIIARKNIRALYDRIKQQAGIPAESEINIEGLVVSDTQAYLFHRGNVNTNVVAEIELDSFMTFLTTQEGRVPEINAYHFELPDYNNVASGFSGACMYKNQGLLFTASLEDTKSEVADGAVLGSYIGYIPFKGLHESTYYARPLTDANGHLVPTKLESISVIVNKNNKSDVLAVCDNDDGSSDIYELELTLKNTD